MSSKRVFVETAAAAAAPAPEKRGRLSDESECTRSSSSSNNNKKPRKINRNDKWRTNCEIHGSTFACPVVSAIIGTPAVQRLRKVKQLGTCDWVYINTNHTRLEHCLGVMMLAVKLFRSIMAKQPNLKATKKDELCVSLAGLLHDIGHGPFSHVYESFVRSVLPKYLEDNPHLKEFYENVPDLPDGWQHELVSLMMIDLALEDLGLAIDLERLDEPLKEIGGDGAVKAITMRVFSHDEESESDDDMSMILTSRDFVFIKECIYGKPIPEVQEKLGVNTFIGRPDPHKEWLYDIVCNRHSGLDVDKIDYFARDERRAFGEAGEIDKLVIEDAVVTWADCSQDPGGKCVRCNNKFDNERVGQHLMICYPKKSYLRCLSFFKTRYDLHQKVYHHETVCAASLQVCDILCKADPYFRLKPDISNRRTSGKAKRDYESLPISRAMLDPHVFLRLNDSSILDIIASKEDENLKEAQALIRQYTDRKLYKCSVDKSIKLTKPVDDLVWKKTELEIEEDMLKIEHKQHGNMKLEKGDFIVQKCNIHYGSKDLNPLNSMRFVDKNQLPLLTLSDIEKLPMAKKMEEDSFGDADLPRSFQKCFIRVYARDHQKRELVAHVFYQWFEKVKDTADGATQTTGPVLEEHGAYNDRAMGDDQCPMPCSQESGDENENDGYNDEDADMLSPKPAHQGMNGQTPKITPPRQALPKKNLLLS